MNLRLVIGMVVLAACGLVVWALQPGTLRAPGPGIAGHVSLTVRPEPAVPDRAAAPEADPATNGFGTITGRIVFDGEIPERRVLIRVGDEKVKAEDRPICAREERLDESLIVDAQIHGIANVFVYLPKATRGIHPRLQASREQHVDADIRECRFEPHVLFARTDQAVIVRQLDDCTHNVHEHPKQNVKFGGVIPTAQREMKFTYRLSERAPVKVQCDFHPWMSAWWLILNHPYAAITNAQGRFTIADLPAGSYEFWVWHEIPGHIRRDWKVSVSASVTTDLGELRVPAQRFADATGR
jgi:hypothetical protein